MPKGLKGFQKGNRAGRKRKGEKRPDAAEQQRKKNNNPFWDHGKVKRVRDLKRSIKKSFCEWCKFIAEHACQLDIDHKDGNRNNHRRSNLQTLCSNCHRLKTWKEKEYSNKRRYKKKLYKSKIK